MFTFVFQPKTNRETLREFNERLHEYCAENPVTSVEATVFGTNLIIQGTVADDMDVDGVPTFTATVRTLDPDDVDLEEQLDGLIAQELAKHPTEDDDGDDPNMPVKFIVASGEKRSWVVLLCINGVAEDGDDDADGGGEDGPVPIAPVATPSFQG